MTISLSPGPDIRIPNHQLVIPNYSIDSQGLIVEANSSSRELLINRLESATANHMPQLGRPFFSSAYLFVHQDQDQFTLWKGNPTVTERNLVSIGAPSCSSDVHTTSSSLNSTGSASTPQPADGKGSTNTGGIAGIVIGSLAGLAIVSLLIYRYCRRYKSRPPPPVSEPILDVRSQESAVPLYSSSTPGVPIHMQPPQELPLERNPSYVFGPFEMGETVNTKLMEQRR